LENYRTLALYSSQRKMLINRENVIFFRKEKKKIVYISNAP